MQLYLTLERGSDLTLGRRRGPHGQPGRQAMPQDTGPEVLFVVPLDLGHREQTVRELGPTGAYRQARRDLVFHDVPALQSAGAVHGRQPAGHMAEQRERASHRAGPSLAGWGRLPPDPGEHAADQLAVMPFLLLDLTDPRSFIRIPDGFPVATVREGSGKLARVGELENGGQWLEGGGQGRRLPGGFYPR